MFDFVPADSIEITRETGSVIVGKLTKTLPHSNYVRQERTLAISASSVEAFLHYVQKEMPTPKRDGASDRAKSPNDKFYTFANYHEAVTTYLERPHEVRKFDEKDVAIRVPESSGNDIFFDVTGDFLDIGKYLEGVPEVFGNMYMGNPNNIFADVVLNLCATSYFDEAALRRRGERIVRLIDWLEAQRIRTTIRAFMSNNCIHAEILVKRAEDILDLNAIAVVSHSDFFRRVMFRAMEYSDTWTYGYGTSCLVYTQRMKMPQMEQQGILIFSENQEEVGPVNTKFDAAERGIETMIDEGGRQFAINT